MAAEGKIYLPFGEDRHAPVAVEDIASVIVGILTDPELWHVGQAYVLTGGSEISMADIADTFGHKGFQGLRSTFLAVPLNRIAQDRTFADSGWPNGYPMLNRMGN